MADNTRELVLDLLLEAEKGKESPHELTKAVLDKYDYLMPQEKAFIKRLSEGTIERQIELDYVLNQISSVPANKMKPLIRCLMRMSVYQLLYMDAIPDSAVCNEAVKLAGRRKFVNLKGFVNGVLRRVARERGNITYPDIRKEPVKGLSVKYSVPEWLTGMWLEEYGWEITVRLLEEQMKVRPVSIRFRAGLDKEARSAYIAQMEQKGVKVSPSPYLPYAFLLTGVEGVASLPGFQEGAFTVQDVSSMLAMEAASVGPGDQVLDVCAAPGGKSLFACERAGKVTARDVTDKKTALIEENAMRMGADNLVIQVWDGTVFDESLEETADILLMDVPCSGLGVIGRKRDIKYHVTPRSLTDITLLQKQLVQACWRYVKPGGILLYSTCTVRREENEEMVRWIMEELPFEADGLEACLPGRLKEELAVLVPLLHRDGLTREQEDCMVQLIPGYMESDGFFYARLRRRD